MRVYIISIIIHLLDMFTIHIRILYKDSNIGILHMLKLLS